MCAIAVRFNLLCEETKNVLNQLLQNPYREAVFRIRIRMFLRGPDPQILADPDPGQTFPNIVTQILNIAGHYC